MGVITVLVAIVCVFVGPGAASRDELKYSFKYTVEEGDVITHRWEEQRGDIVHGSYSLLQPDGLIRIVEYTADDKRGFQAIVQHRQPPSDSLLLGHLRYPGPEQTPVKLSAPVNVISRDLFKSRKAYEKFAQFY